MDSRNASNACPMGLASIVAKRDGSIMAMKREGRRAWRVDAKWSQNERQRSIKIRNY